ncbi:MAG: hypothetical protein M0Z55_04410 [Peptococcaceae bacterium]|nr:hypothetical protein [Peptococcaceae bacterium]
MDTLLEPLLSRLAGSPADQVAWQQIKRQIKLSPEATCCQLLFGHLAVEAHADCLPSVLIEHGLEVFEEVIHFYREFLSKTQTYGDIWGGGREFWATVQFFEVWAAGIMPRLSTHRLDTVNQVLARLRSVASAAKINIHSGDLNLPFLPQEVAWNLTLYFTPSVILADYPEFKHLYFLPAELIPLALELENYKLSPRSNLYLKKLLHATRKSAIETSLLNFAQTFPLILHAKWAYAIYLSLAQGEVSAHPFVLRLLTNSYWEAKAAGQLAGQLKST